MRQSREQSLICLASNFGCLLTSTSLTFCGVTFCGLLGSLLLASTPANSQTSAQVNTQANTLSPNAENIPEPKATDGWLLLYPQHPMYRRAVQRENSQPGELPKTGKPLAGESGKERIVGDLGSTGYLFGSTWSKANSSLVQTASKPERLKPGVALQTPAIAVSPTNQPTNKIQEQTQEQTNYLTQRQTQASKVAPIPPVVSSNPPLFIQPVTAPEIQTQPRGPKYFPGFSAGSPSGFGANWGDLFAGLSLINRSSPIGSATDKADGSISIGAGFGNSQDLLGFEAVYNLISLTPSRFASNGSFDFKVHRALPDLMSVSVGWENAINYGPEAGGTASSVYGAFSKYFVLQPDDPTNPMLLSFTIGAGGGRFRSFNDQVNGVGSIGIFGNVGLQVLPNLSVITDWTGQTLNLGLSYVPFANFPLYLNGTAVDVAGNTNIGIRYSLGVGFGYNFR